MADIPETATVTLSRGTAAAGGDVHVALRRREDVKREQALFAEFYEQYDALVCLLCAAAQLGIEPQMEGEYREARAWFEANYSQSVKPLVGPYIDTVVAGSGSGPGLMGLCACDAFEALYVPATIATMLDTDGGNLIGHLMSTQEALAAWETRLARDAGTVAAADAGSTVAATHPYQRN